MCCANARWKKKTKQNRNSVETDSSLHTCGFLPSHLIWLIFLEEKAQKTVSCEESFYETALSQGCLWPCINSLIFV